MVCFKHGLFHNTEPFPYVSRKNINFNFFMVVASFSYAGFLKVASLPVGWSVQLRFVLYIRKIKKKSGCKREGMQSCWL